MEGQLAAVLDYCGKVYCDMNGVTYHHFRIRGLPGDGALLRIPVDLVGTKLNLKEGSIVMIQLTDFTWVKENAQRP